VKRPALRGVLLFAGRSTAGTDNALISLDIPPLNSKKYNSNVRLAPTQPAITPRST